MKNTLSILLLLSLVAVLNSCSSTKSVGMMNMVATMQVDEPIPGVCDNSRVFAILPIKGNGQVEAQAPLTEPEIEAKLNEEVAFLKENPDYNDKGMVGLIVNCKGNMVRCEIDNKTKSPELDDQIVAVFATMKNWKAGTMNGQAVDTSVLYSFQIKDGKITL